MQNSALNLLRHIGGSALAMTQAKQERKEIAEFLRKDAKEHPPEPRLPKLLRQYLKRYRNNLAEYIRAKRDGRLEWQA